MILKELIKKICSDLEINKLDLTRNESNIIHICSEIIDARLEEMVEIEKENRRLKIEIKNLKIEVEDMRKDKS